LLNEPKLLPLSFSSMPPFFPATQKEPKAIVAGYQL
jgi:hypothetical protein